MASSIPTSFSRSSTFFCTSSSGRRKCCRSPKATFSPTSRKSNSAEYWNTIPICLRISFHSSSVRWETSCPSMKTFPPVGASSPIRTFRIVLFPVPEGPITAIVSPFLTSRLTPCNTFFSPKASSRFRREITDSAITPLLFVYVQQNRQKIIRNKYQNNGKHYGSRSGKSHAFRALLCVQSLETAYDTDNSTKGNTFDHASE